MRRRESWFTAVLAGVVVAGGIAVAITVNWATDGDGSLPPWLAAVKDRAWWWTAGLTAGLVAAAVLAWWLPRRRAVRGVAPVDAPSGRWVDRPAELNAVAVALCRRDGGTVGITTGLHGAGGFGKTTLAAMVCADRRVRRRFRGRVITVTIGRDARTPEAIVVKVNDVIRSLLDLDVGAAGATFDSPEQAGRRLGELLDEGPRTLLVIDDVWFPEQLSPFVRGGRRCARLVTTRHASLLAGHGPGVRVDQMSPVQARQVLVRDIPLMDEHIVQRLLGMTGRWPLLLGLVNRILADLARTGGDVSVHAAELCSRLERGGPGATDLVTGEAGRELRVDDPQERRKAVWATIEASADLLTGSARERLAELAVFAEDESVPVTVVTALWHATAGLPALEAGLLVTRLADLALISADSDGLVAMHDVIREFFGDRLGQQRIAELHGALLDAVGPRLPADAGSPCWWELDDRSRYLWDRLIWHMVGAGRSAAAEALASDLRWVGARLRRSGPAAPHADLALLRTPRARRLGVALARAAHLLTPTDPPGAVIDVLHSRLTDDPDWGPKVAALRDAYPRPRLVNRWSPPDLPDPALVRVIPDSDFWVARPAAARLAVSDHTTSTVTVWDPSTGTHLTTVAGTLSFSAAAQCSADGTWLVTDDRAGVVRCWDTTTGAQRSELAAQRHVVATGISPDGAWMVTVTDDGKGTIWDAATGAPRTNLNGNVGRRAVVTISPDGTWLVTTAARKSEYMGTMTTLWDVATGEPRGTLHEPTSKVTSMVVAPDGSWLATAGMLLRDPQTGEPVLKRDVSIWDTATGTRYATLAVHPWGQPLMAVSSDGTWLVVVDERGGGIRIWDTVTRTLQAEWIGPAGTAHAMTLAPDKTWLAVATDRTVTIWNTADATVRTGLDCHDPASAMDVASDGTLLAVGLEDGSVLLWDAIAGDVRGELTGHTRAVEAMTIAPDASWLVTQGKDSPEGRHRSTRIWDPAAARGRTSAQDPSALSAVAVASDGTWLTAGTRTGTVQIWDTIDGALRTEFSGPPAIRPESTSLTLALAPDGTWLAAGGFGALVWDTGSGTVLTQLARSNWRTFVVAVSADGAWLAVVGEQVQIWEAGTWRLKAQWEASPGLSPKAVAMSPAGDWLAICHGSGVELREVATGADLGGVEVTWGYSALAISPDGTRLATASNGRTAQPVVEIWNLADLSLDAELTAHGSTAFSMPAVEFSPDGRWLAGIAGNTLFIWATATWQPVTCVRFEHDGTGCAWFPDSSTIAVSGLGGLYLFNVLGD